MALEDVNDNGTARLNQLVVTNPTGTDNKNQGDDHIRNIKRAIVDQFSGISGDSGSGSVTANATELNKLDGCTATTSNLNALAGIDNIFNVVYPVGCIYESTSGTHPNTLFAGTTWSVFGQGKMLVGLDSGDTDFNQVNKTDGSKTVTLTTDQIPSHNHSFSGSSGSAGSHNHTYSGTTSNHGGHSHNYTVRTGRSYSSSTGSADNGVVQGSNGVQRDSSTQSTASAGSHSHTYSGTTSSHGGHSHSISGTIGNKGSGTAHDNMPPYTVVYRWKRDS
jgi:microcystin-dependent protein